MTDIREKIKNHVADLAKGVIVKDIRIGLIYTAVLLDNRCVGLAFTPHREMPNGCSLFPNGLPQINTPAIEFLELITSDNKIKTAVGLATANAITNIKSNDFTSGDVLDVNPLYPDDCVGMVGHFAPLTAPIRKKTAKLIIFEQVDKPHGNLIPSAEIDKQLPECTVAFITATSIINHTFDHIMKAAVNCREVIILGASTPLVPDVFAKTPVTSISGVIVKDATQLLRIVSLGGGMRLFKNSIEKVNLKV